MCAKTRENPDPKLLEAIARVTGKRPRTVLEHILKHGFITTEELGGYGYNHPPRAARDVREAGVPLETFRVRATDGRSIGAYRLGDPDAIERNKLGGRSVLSKELGVLLYEASGGRCYGCFHPFERRYLTIDHRVPYEVAGEAASPDDVASFMLLCGTCQRKKSWSCEHCPNWVTKNPVTCAACFWARPEEYTHVATATTRRVELVFTEAEIRRLEEIRDEAAGRGISLQAALKERALRR
jgi:hypothetical protein